MPVVTKSADVIVIGAGMSGVAAATTLRQFGISSIVLEGRPDRIGWRIWSSYKWKEAPVDLGASWVTHMTINLGHVVSRIAQKTAGVTVTTNRGDFTAHAVSF